MDFSILNLDKVAFVVLIAIFVEPSVGERTKYPMGSTEKPVQIPQRLYNIPLKFEVSGKNSAKDFQKYFNKIEDLAHANDVTVKYKVKVETSKPLKRKTMKKKQVKKTKTKKYNIPLKKNNMKLSNHEILMRRLAEEKPMPRKEEIYNDIPTTESQIEIFTTRQSPLGKYKPIISRFKPNYSRRVKPVKSNVITL